MLTEISRRLNECAMATPEYCKQHCQYSDMDYIGCQDKLIQEMAKECREIERKTKMEVKECSCCGEKTDEKRLEIFDYVFCEKCAERYRATTRRFVKKFCNNKVDERLKIDWDKVCALANAGWDYKQIAEEVGCCPGTIRNQLQDRLMDYNVHGVRFTKHSILEDN